MRADRSRVLAALTVATAAYSELTKDQSLLGRSPPDAAALAPLIAVLSETETYKAVAGRVLFSANSGVVIQASELAYSLLLKAQFHVPAAVDWLFQLLTTREAKGLFKAAIWGLEVDAPVTLPDGAVLVPFWALAPSAMKQNIEDRARPLYDDFAWVSQTYFALPLTAYVREVDDFPFIRQTNEAFLLIEEIEEAARVCWAEIEAISAGSPLAIGYWFEYENRDLDYKAWENTLSWSLPEITPRIKRTPALAATLVTSQIEAFSILPRKLQSRLHRSMKRFTLSQCRHEEMDQVLDLALAFEIAVSEGNDRSPPSMKVATRSAQMVGGSLSDRRTIRDAVAVLYDMRNRATHGGSLTGKGRPDQTGTLASAAAIYRRLLLSMLEFGISPDWKTIELEPRKIGNES